MMNFCWIIEMPRFDLSRAKVTMYFKLFYKRTWCMKFFGRLNLGASRFPSDLLQDDLRSGYAKMTEGHTKHDSRWYRESSFSLRLTMTATWGMSPQVIRWFLWTHQWSVSYSIQPEWQRLNSYGKAEVWQKQVLFYRRCKDKPIMMMWRKLDVTILKSLSLSKLKSINAIIANKVRCSPE